MIQVEKNENIVSAAKRELQEESGLEVDEDNLKKVSCMMDNCFIISNCG